MVLSAMADDHQEHIQARWALQTNDPRFVTTHSDFSNFIWLRRECLSLRTSQSFNRGPLRALQISWDDLMVWSVLSGHHDIANSLWKKQKTPMRAALTASAICMRLATHSELVSDHEELKEKAEEYEALAIDLLDAIRDKETAFHLITLLVRDARQLHTHARTYPCNHVPTHLSMPLQPDTSYMPPHKHIMRNHTLVLLAPLAPLAPLAACCLPIACPGCAMRCALVLMINGVCIAVPMLCRSQPWAYMDSTRPGDRAEPVLKQTDNGEWAAAVGFTSEDVGAEVKIVGEIVVVSRYDDKGGKVGEHAFTARWARGAHPPSDFEGGIISSVDPKEGGKVRIDEAEVELTNPQVKIRRVFLWNNSCLDMASTEGGLSFPSIQFVAHRHCQGAFDRFFVGDFPDSRGCIEPYVGLQQILLQAMLPFLSIVNVYKPADELQENHNRLTDVGSPAASGSLREEYIADNDGGNETDPQLEVAMRDIRRARSMARGLKAPGISRLSSNGGAGDAASSFCAAAKNVAIQLATCDYSSLVASADVLKEAAGQKLAGYKKAVIDKLEFYFIPKVKFAVWFASHLLYTLLLTHLGIYFSEDRRLWYDLPGIMELLFYFWSGARLLSEAAEFGGDDKGFVAHVKAYLSDPWNALDSLLNLLIVSLMMLRLHTVTLDEESAILWGEDHWAAILGSNQFAIMIVLCWFRALQFLGYFQSLGVLQIVLRDMLNDIVIWTVLSLVISLGFGFAFVVLLPSSAANHSVGDFMGLHPVYESIWLWVGSGVHSSRGEMEVSTGSEVPTNLVMPSLMWIYQFIIGVLLVNLLIAMMSDTYARVMDKGRERWTFERAQLILEFKNTKGPLPPPFNVLWTVLVEWRQEADADEMDISGFKTVPHLKLLKKLEIAESAARRKCITMRDDREKGEMAWEVSAIREQLGVLQEAGRTQYESLARSIVASKKGKSSSRRR